MILLIIASWCPTNSCWFSYDTVINAVMLRTNPQIVWTIACAYTYMYSFIMWYGRMWCDKWFVAHCCCYFFWHSCPPSPSTTAVMLLFLRGRSEKILKKKKGIHQNSRKSLSVYHELKVLLIVNWFLWFYIIIL